MYRPLPVLVFSSGLDDFGVGVENRCGVEETMFKVLAVNFHQWTFVQSRVRKVSGPRFRSPWSEMEDVGSSKRFLPSGDGRHPPYPLNLYWESIPRVGLSRFHAQVVGRRVSVSVSRSISWCTTAGF